MLFWDKKGAVMVCFSVGLSHMKRPLPVYVPIDTYAMRF
jgi:hypothetical protein